jgi:formylglycine-generating enzyme required for sulfatase activity
MGFNTRHAVSRALATANLGLRDATYKILAARVWLNGKGEVARGEVTVSIRKPRALGDCEGHEIDGWVNPDGEHPEMVLFRHLPEPLFVGVFPITWKRWLADNPHEVLPEGRDSFHPRTGLSHAEAEAYAASRGMRLPRGAELQSLWGRRRFPWGDDKDNARGAATPPRYGGLFEVGLHPPVGSLFDLGAWLWQWIEDGAAAGRVLGRRPIVANPPLDGPVGVRLVADT